MASLVLSDGTTWHGELFGSRQETDGEVVFSTGMVGYPESMTDPSFRGQILVFTYPLIGNYGVPSEERNAYGFSKNFESEDIQVRAVICAQVSEFYSHHTAVESLPAWMERHGIPGLTGVDTRALTKHLREKGVMLGRIICDDSLESRDQRTEASAPHPSPFPQREGIADPNDRNLVAEVSIREPVTYEPDERLAVSDERLVDGNSSLITQNSRLTVLAYDCGMKRNILRSFLKRSVRVIRVPWDYDLASHSGKVDGVFCSNGPGDPKRCTATIKALKHAVDRGIPTFGICLGNQLLALAVGGDTYKLKYGHRGANQPAVEEVNGAKTGRCLITSQNHGFAVDDQTLPKDWSVWWRNGNDGSVEGIRHSSGKFFSVQFHPEATPGPEDAGYLFDEFIDTMRG